MTKEAERLFMQKLGEEGWAHSLNKPFSEPGCWSNLVTMGFMMSQLPEPPARILDLGCGGGWSSRFFAQRGYSVTGQDICADMVRIGEEGRDRNPVPLDLNFIVSDYESLALENEFDAAFFIDSLHHAEDELAAIRSAYRALKPGGILMTREPGEGHSEAPWSIAAVEEYGVTERDMPPHLIIRRGLEVGFTSYRVFPAPEEMKDIFFRPRTPRIFGRLAPKLAFKGARLALRPSRKNGAIMLLRK
ncbi:class I SAM-dependent methyltransferase [Sphingomonas crocodyli]|uniref:Class I SAM-dependent methyltransferase n=1 Tax=Sphingomonas crocodyli TaxID=1979270 RepID=A0A437LUX2_9SPHN|nr:class I SAM-dependent methyltransferase [Sphingomonas crocodyli]RVT89189.1 class I SAM-dependent methyltransferase [Sphingomonas crocodyli]